MLLPEFLLDQGAFGNRPGSCRWLHLINISEFPKRMGVKRLTTSQLAHSKHGFTSNGLSPQAEKAWILKQITPSDLAVFNIEKRIGQCENDKYKILVSHSCFALTSLCGMSRPVSSTLQLSFC